MKGARYDNAVVRAREFDHEIARTIKHATKSRSVRSHGVRESTDFIQFYSDVKRQVDPLPLSQCDSIVIVGSTRASVNHNKKTVRRREKWCEDSKGMIIFQCRRTTNNVRVRQRNRGKVSYVLAEMTLRYEKAHAKFL